MKWWLGDSPSSSAVSAPLQPDESAVGATCQKNPKNQPKMSFNSEKEKEGVGRRGEERKGEGVEKAVKPLPDLRFASGIVHKKAIYLSF
jgi:hypothetical protein